MGGSSEAPDPKTWRGWGDGRAKDTTDWAGLQTGITDAATQQYSNNRINTSNPFASQTFDHAGHTSTQFGGGLGDAANGLQNQVASMGQPLDWNQFGTPGNGNEARDQTISASYDQASSRLNPQWNHAQGQMNANLANRGLGSGEAARHAQDQFSMGRNDAYSGAMNNAIDQGNAAGASVYQNNMLAQQQSVAEALRQRGQPLEEMTQLNGMLGQPNYNADGSTLAGAMGAGNIALGANGIRLGVDAFNQQQGADFAGGATNFLGSVGSAAFNKWGKK